MTQPAVIPMLAYEDAGRHHASAVAAGARVISGLETNPLQRQYRVEDLEGHRWMFATRS